jgi:hypothetical protein
LSVVPIFIKPLPIITEFIPAVLIESIPVESFIIKTVLVEPTVLRFFSPGSPFAI